MTFATPQSIAVEFGEVTDPHTSQHRLKEMVDILQRKLKASPSNPDIREYLGIALFRIGDIDDGLSKMKSALTINPSAATAGNLVLGYRRAGMWDESLVIHLKYHDLTEEPVLFSALLSGNYSQEVLSACRTDEQRETLNRIAKSGLPISAVIRDIYNSVGENTEFAITVTENSGQDCVDIHMFTNESVEKSVNISDSVFRCLVDNYDSDVLE